MGFVNRMRALCWSLSLYWKILQSICKPINIAQLLFLCSWFARQWTDSFFYGLKIDIPMLGLCWRRRPKILRGRHQLTIKWKTHKAEQWVNKSYLCEYLSFSICTAGNEKTVTGQLRVNKVTFYICCIYQTLLPSIVGPCRQADRHDNRTKTKLWQLISVMASEVQPHVTVSAVVKLTVEVS